MKKLGFGCMRLPLDGGGAVDLRRFSGMADEFLAAGFTCFDTARGYHRGQSEAAVRECVVKRHPRESFLLADKLTEDYFQREEDIRPLFFSQLRETGAGYFDCYLMHALNGEYYQKFEACRAFEAVARLREEGLVRRMGISFHDKPALLETILARRPEIEVVQIQLNYADWDSPSVESEGVYQVCRRFQKPVIAMEPVKGGGLANLPDKAAAVLRDLGGGGPAGYALRWCASLPGVELVLSGMSDEAQLRENLAALGELRPLSPEEREAVDRVREILKGLDEIPCTACRYCEAGCPGNIPIPDIFSCANAKRRYGGWNSQAYYETSVRGRGKASDCTACGRCQRVCPQRLPVVRLLGEAAELFDAPGDRG